METRSGLGNTWNEYGGYAYIFLIFAALALGMTAAGTNHGITGYAVFDINAQQDYTQTRKVTGIININFSSQVLIPDSALLGASAGSQSKGYSLSSLLQDYVERGNGTFFFASCLNYSGEGYGVKGNSSYAEEGYGCGFISGDYVVVQINLSMYNLTAPAPSSNLTIYLLHNSSVIDTSTYPIPASAPADETINSTEKSADSSPEQQTSDVSLTGATKSIVRIDEKVRLAVKILLDNDSISFPDISRASVTVTGTNESPQAYDLSYLSFTDSSIYLDGSFNGTGIYYLDWNADVSSQAGHYREVILVTDLAGETMLPEEDILLIQYMEKTIQYFEGVLAGLEGSGSIDKGEPLLVASAVDRISLLVNEYNSGRVLPLQLQQGVTDIRSRVQSGLGKSVLGYVINTTPAETDNKMKDMIPIIIMIQLMTVAIILLIKQIKSEK